VRLTQLSSELSETALLSGGELNTSRASVRGLKTLADFRTAAVDADHFVTDGFKTRRYAHAPVPLATDEAPPAAS